MTNEKTSAWKAILTGELETGQSREQAIANLAKTLKKTGAEAEAILNACPKVLKSGLDSEKAQTYQTLFKRLGLKLKLQPELSSGSQSEPTAAEPPKTAKPQSTPALAEAAPAAGSNQTLTVQPSGEDQSNASIYEPENPSGMAFKIEGKPDYAFLTVQVPANETIKVEASAMATMDTHMVMKTKVRGGLGRFLTGENIFINEFSAEAGPGEIGIAPGTPGDLTHQYLDDSCIFLQNSAFVAAGMDVAVETKWQGLTKGFFSGESLFLIRCSGRGDLWFNTYGALIEIDVTEDYVVDTGNIVAFTDGLEYRISKVGGYKSLFFSGEGFVCRFSGKGKVWIQTRGTAALVAWAHWFRPVKKKG